MDITEINKDIIDNNNNRIYLLNIIDHFSKYAWSFIQSTKSSEETFKNIKNFIDKNGPPEIIQCDNGGEFKNNLFKKFCEESNISLIHGADRYPQSKGAIESFNKHIKNLLKIIKLKDKDKFNLENAVKNAILIYNNSTHSVIKVKPKNAFNFSNKKDLEQIVKNQLKSQENKFKDLEPIKNGQKCLLASN